MSIDEERIRWRRGSEPTTGDFVLYWMQSAQRTLHNHALEFAAQQANEAGVPLVVLFCAVADYPDASARHMRFMFEGLADVEKALQQRSIGFEVLQGRPSDIVPALDHRAAAIVFDRDYMPLTRSWRNDILDATSSPIAEVETNVVVPVDLVSDSAQTAARTIRPKINEHLERFLVDLPTTAVDVGIDTVSFSLARTAGAASLNISDPDAAVKEIDISPSPGPVEEWSGGQNQAQATLRSFIADVLDSYDDLRNRFDLADSSSALSPYLHFGQISPVDVAMEVRASDAPDEHIESFIDELVVRRELAVNLVLHNDSFDSFSGLPDWAQESLRTHSSDERDHVYTATELEEGRTHDEIWNAVMDEIRERGWVHNQLRMYWGKQILNWTNTPEHAYRTLLDLNNRYFLDGRDPNSYANVGWCFGLHDQGFKERDVIGKIRPFTDAALKRKGDLQGWLDERS